MFDPNAFDDKFIIPNLSHQLGFDMDDAEQLNKQSEQGIYFTAPDIDLDRSEKIILAMSSGKDSIACLLRLIELGVDLNRVEAWHHDVDGREGSTLMDWAFMADYNRAVCKAFGIPLYFSWLKHGFEGEMLKENSYSHAHCVETPDGLIELPRDTSRATPATCLKFPQQGASLQTRWCSSALKIEVAKQALNNQDRFLNQRTLFITGERREESANRARYNQLEPHSCDRRHGKLARHVDHWRPVLAWNEEQVWDILRRHHVVAPVPYRLGFGRSSCRTCIFNSARIWATLRHYFPGSLDGIAAYEDRFGTTISRNRINVLDLSNTAKPIEIDDEDALKQALQTDYTLPVIVTSGWKMPIGAFSAHGCGPS